MGEAERRACRARCCAPDRGARRPRSAHTALTHLLKVAHAGLADGLLAAVPAPWRQALQLADRHCRAGAAIRVALSRLLSLKKTFSAV